ncbi:MAG TPA: hypothetical protein VHU87_05965 [Rhizomicrobium sp.]|nr:hypothetical protein [Rhizomicrobium sp.]
MPPDDKQGASPVSLTGAIREVSKKPAMPVSVQRASLGAALAGIALAQTLPAMAQWYVLTPLAVGVGVTLLTYLRSYNRRLAAGDPVVLAHREKYFTQHPEARADIADASRRVAQRFLAVRAIFTLCTIPFVMAAWNIALNHGYSPRAALGISVLTAVLLFAAAIGLTKLIFWSATRFVTT